MTDMTPDDLVLDEPPADLDAETAHVAPILDRRMLRWRELTEDLR